MVLFSCLQQEVVMGMLSAFWEVMVIIGQFRIVVITMDFTLIVCVLVPMEYIRIIMNVAMVILFAWYKTVIRNK